MSFAEVSRLRHRKSVRADVLRGPFDPGGQPSLEQDHLMHVSLFAWNVRSGLAATEAVLEDPKRYRDFWSDLGIDFATRQCDAIFISAMRKGDQGPAEMAKAYGEMAKKIRSAAAAHNRKVRICAMCFVVMDETDEKAAETVKWLEDEIDVEAVTNQYRSLSGNIAGVALNKEWLYAFGLGLNGNQIFGSYTTVADRLAELYEAGIQQVALYVWDPRRSVERFGQHVMPLLRERGLRNN